MFLFCEHPNKPLKQEGYCSYYSEIFYALRDIMDIEYISCSPKQISELGNHWEAIVLGFGHTDCGDENKPRDILRDIDIPTFPILNKEYTGLHEKLNWIRNMNATAALTVHHDYNQFRDITGIPFHRIMWSANEHLFKDYEEGYSCDLFFSGVTRPEQTENLRERILSDMSRLSNYNLCINARSHKHNYSGKIFSPQEYARSLASSKICFITTGPADLVGTRYFEVMSGNRSLILCNKIEGDVYGDMLKDNYNCIMFEDEKDFFYKCAYYLEHEDERMAIVSKAYDDFIQHQTWKTRALHIQKILEKYV